jgi:predicted small lipoprotein YifL
VRTVVASLLSLAALAVIGSSCGKKGPPLVPFAKAPAAPLEVTARRQGARVEIRFTVPNRDVDAQRPANIDRVEVWALTGPMVAAPLMMKYGTLVATVPVRKPPPPPPEVEEGKPPPPPPPPSTEPGLEQGQVGVVVDELTPEELAAVTVPEVEKARAEDERLVAERIALLGPPNLTPPLVGPALPPTPKRYYIVLGRNGGRKGASTRPIAVPLSDPPPAPPQPTGVAAESYFELAWNAPEGLRRAVHAGTALPSPGRPGATSGPATSSPAGPAGPLLPVPPPPSAADEAAAPAQEVGAGVPPATPQDPAVAPTSQEASPAPKVPRVLNSRSLTGFRSPTTAYAVYEVAPSHLTPAPLQPGEVPPLPRRLTPQPLAVTTWRDAPLDVGTERCYAVRTVETSGTEVVESEASPTLCISPTDIFPPKPPANLAAVASEGAISLIWEANAEPDLAGYIVLRGEAPGATLRPLMTEPIKDTTYRDTTTKAGVRYIYTVVAVDTATPQNVSTQSNRVEETAR